MKRASGPQTNRLYIKLDRSTFGTLLFTLLLCIECIVINDLLTYSQSRLQSRPLCRCSRTTPAMSSHSVQQSPQAPRDCEAPLFELIEVFKSLISLVAKQPSTIGESSVEGCFATNSLSLL